MKKKKRQKSQKRKMLEATSCSPVVTTGAAYLDLGTQDIKPMISDRTSSSQSFNLPMNSKEKIRRLERKARFAGSKIGSVALDPLYQPLTTSRKSQKAENVSSDNEDTLIGECMTLEKPYLRLTDFPKKQDVRPLEVLVKSLAMIKSRYIKDEDFVWANEQLKSVRQDLTVQRLRNSFVLDVYETHARILLEEGDLDEFNQCQSVIQSLTGDVDASGSVSGGKAPLSQGVHERDEFRGYAILYACVHKSWVQLKMELSCAHGAAAGSTDRESSTMHAIQVVKAVEHCDYRAFFRLYENPPHLSAYLMDFLVKRVRDAAYLRIVASYRPTISVEYVRDAIHFEDLEETRRYLTQRGASFVHEEGQPPFWIDCKATATSS